MSALRLFLLLLAVGLLPLGSRAQDELPPKRKKILVCHPQPLVLRDVRPEVQGRLEPSAVVPIQAQVSGVVRTIKAKGGEFVRKGDVLIELDPKPFDLAVKRAEGELALALLRFDGAEREWKTLEKGRVAGAVPEERVRRAQSAAREAQATIPIVRLQVEQARRQRANATVLSPVSGRLSPLAVVEGQHVLSAGERGPVLGAVVVLGSLRCSFSVPGVVWREIVAARKGKASVGVKVGPVGDLALPWKGAIDYIDYKADPRTGEVRMTATLAAPPGDLLPGMAVRVAPEVLLPRRVWLVPAAAVFVGKDDRPTLVVIQRLPPPQDVQPVAVKSVTAHPKGRIVQSEALSERSLLAVERFVLGPGESVAPEVVPFDKVKPPARKPEPKSP